MEGTADERRRRVRVAAPSGRLDPGRHPADQEGRDGTGVITQLAACPEHSTAPDSRSPRGLRERITGAGTATQNREQRETLFPPLA